MRPPNVGLSDKQKVRDYRSNIDISLGQLDFHEIKIAPLLIA
jgi:hypothetical protein